MAQVFGQFQEDLPKGDEYLILRFSPSSAPLKERWRTNGLSADFMADYMATFFPGENRIPVKSAVSFIANELLENTMKYNDDSSMDPITIALYLQQESLIFLTTNSIDPQVVPEFQTLLQGFIDSDPAELLMSQLENNASEGSSHSGLGYLTMMVDYQAALGWKFEITSPERGSMEVTTMVKLPSESL